MLLVAVIERVWRCTWTPSLIGIEGVLVGGRSEAVNREGGAPVAEALFIC
jgi:hypothetical protein